MRTDSEFLAEVLRRRGEGLKKQKKRRRALRAVGGVLCLLLLMLPVTALLRVPASPGYAELTREEAIGRLKLASRAVEPTERTYPPDPKKGSSGPDQREYIGSKDDPESDTDGEETAAAMESIPHEEPEKPTVSLFTLLFEKDGREKAKKKADEAARQRLETLLSSLPLLLPCYPDRAETIAFSCGADGVLCEEVTVSGWTLHIRYEVREAAGGLYAEGIVLGQEARFYLHGENALLLLGAPCSVSVTFPADGSPVEWKQMLEAFFYLRAPTEITTK